MNPLKPQPIFGLIQQESKFSDDKMYSAFNMGMGFFVVAKKENVGHILQIARDAAIVGEVRKNSRSETTTILEIQNKKIMFEGY